MLIVADGGIVLGMEVMDTEEGVMVGRPSLLHAARSALTMLPAKPPRKRRRPYPCDPTMLSSAPSSARHPSVVSYAADHTIIRGSYRLARCIEEMHGTCHRNKCESPILKDFSIASHVYSSHRYLCDGMGMLSPYGHLPPRRGSTTPMTLLRHVSHLALYHRSYKCNIVFNCKYKTMIK